VAPECASVGWVASGDSRSGGRTPDVGVLCLPDLYCTAPARKATARLKLRLDEFVDSKHPGKPFFLLLYV